jgi:hypothetical protein
VRGLPRCLAAKRRVAFGRKIGAVVRMGDGYRTGRLLRTYFTSSKQACCCDRPQTTCDFRCPLSAQNIRFFVVFAAEKKS